MAKFSLKKLVEIKPVNKVKNLSDKEKKNITIAFNIVAIFCIILFSLALAPKTFQNDTFYTIKIGQEIRQNGIDYKDNFSWHEDLPYMYPHWLYDVITSLVYDFMGGYAGIYAMTAILSAILGLVIYFTSKRITKNHVVSFVIALGQMFLMEKYIAARAQLVTFILFVLTILFIEKFLEKPKIRYAIALLIIPTLIANLHSAVFPFYFVLYLPYVGEYALRVLLDWHLPHKIYQWYSKLVIKRANKKLKKVDKEKAKYYQAQISRFSKKIETSNEKFEKFVIKQNDRRKNPYKIKLERNDNVLKLFIIMIIAILTGLLTPIKDMPYTYTWRIMQGNTTASINEHMPLTLINNKPILIAITGIIILGMFTKVKIRLRDLFFIAGLTLLSLMTRRQVSMLVLFGGFALARIVSDLLTMYDKNGTLEFMEYMTSITGELLTILLVLAISYCMYRPNIGAEFINKNDYPVEASEWIKENLDYKNIKLFNDYNFGSYLLLQDIPVFIDSRCDLYTPEFNGTYNNEKKKYEGKDIFSDFMNTASIATYYETKFDEYGITHVIIKNNAKLNMLISRDNKYKQLYKDDTFIIYEKIN